jgi:hypothetical protein
MAKRNWKTIIGAKAKEVYGRSNVTCSVGLRWAGDKYPDAPPAEGFSDGHTWDFNKSEDLADNAFDLRTFKKGWLGKDFTGTLDIWVYSYERFDRDGYHELEFNLYAKFENGVFISVTD